MSQEGIIDVIGAFPIIPTNFVANVGFAIPIANTLELLGSVVSAGSNPFRSIGSGNTITYQVQTSQAIASTNATNVGLAAFNSSDFTVDANGFVSLNGGSGVMSVSGTANRITSTGGANPIIDIAATYVGQTSITTLGTIATGIWNATIVAPLYGGTGVNGSSASNGSLLIGNGTGYSLSTLTAGSGVSITNGSGSIVLSANGGGLTWTVVTGTSQAAAVNNGYIANNAGLVTVTLPATSAVGNIVAITGINNATGWRIAQNSGNQIFFGTSSTTLGTGGSLSSSATRDVVYLMCVVSNGAWQVMSSIGNITVV